MKNRLAPMGCRVPLTAFYQPVKALLMSGKVNIITRLARTNIFEPFLRHLPLYGYRVNDTVEYYSQNSPHKNSDDIPFLCHGSFWL